MSVKGEARFDRLTHISTAEATSIASAAAPSSSERHRGFSLGVMVMSVPQETGSGAPRAQVWSILKEPLGMRQRRRDHRKEQLVALWNRRTDSYSGSPREPGQLLFNAADPAGVESRSDVGRVPSRA